MKRKVVVGPEISRAIRSFGLPREVLLQLLMEIHERLPENHSQQRIARAKDERHYLARIMIPGAVKEHLFVVVVDDSTAGDSLIIFDIGYASHEP